MSASNVVQQKMQNVKKKSFCQSTLYLVQKYLLNNWRRPIVFLFLKSYCHWQLMLNTPIPLLIPCDIYLNFMDVYVLYCWYLMTSSAGSLSSSKFFIVAYHPNILIYMIWHCIWSKSFHFIGFIPFWHSANIICTLVLMIELVIVFISIVIS